MQQSIVRTLTVRGLAGLVAKVNLEVALPARDAQGEADSEATEEQAKTLYLECQRRLGQLLNLRFGFGPASRFLEGTEWDDPDWGEWDDDADWVEAG